MPAATGVSAIPYWLFGVTVRLCGWRLFSGVAAQLSTAYLAANTYIH